MGDQYLQQLTEDTAAATTDVIPVADSGTGQLKKMTTATLLAAEHSLHLPDPSELTIAAGEITLTQSVHTVDTQSDAADDDLDTINFPSTLNLALLLAENSGRTVTLKHGTGNIATGDGSDVAIPDNGFLVVYYDGTTVHVLHPGPHSHAASDITSGTLTHERGGLEADVSAFGGLVKILSGSTSEIKCNFSASAAPTTGDDTGDGYSVGSLWYDTTGDAAYVCLDATAAAAVWLRITLANASGDLIVQSYTDGTRPAAGTAGRIIFNTTDGQLNIDDGTNWTLPDGTTT